MSLKVLISGAGIAGMTLAHWLDRFSFDVTVVEHAPKLRTGGYMIDFFGLGYDVAEKMNIVAALAKEDLRIREIIFVDEHNRRLGTLNAEAIRVALAQRAYNLLRSSLANVIHETVRDKIEVIFGDTISNLRTTADGIEVAFKKGTTRKFDLVVGADGLHSNVRSLAFGEESGFERFYGYYTASYTVAQKLDQRHSMASYSTPGKQVGIYAVDDQRAATFFIFACKDRLHYDRHDSVAQAAILRSKFVNEGWLVPDLLRQIESSPDFYFDVVSQIEMPTWSKERVTLVGDACCCPSLLSGQGSSLAMAGAYVLAGELKRAKGDIAAACARYESLMKPLMENKQKLAQKFAGSFVPHSHAGIWLRNQISRLMIFPAVNHWFLKRFMTENFRLEDYGSDSP